VEKNAVVSLETTGPARNETGEGRGISQQKKKKRRCGPKEKRSGRGLHRLRKGIKKNRT